MSVVLVVDDDPFVCDVLGMYFEREMMDVKIAKDGLAALSAVYLHEPDIVVLDVTLPELDGYDVCKRIRARCDVPIIFLSGKTDETSKLVGLEVGGDDYVVKPFSPREVVARAKTILRRVQAKPQRQNSISLGNLRISVDARETTVAGQSVHLTRREFDILTMLMVSPGVVHTRDQILQQVWGPVDDGLGLRVIDSHLKHLRRKLNEAGIDGCRIETILGVGYRLVNKTEESATANNT